MFLKTLLNQKLVLSTAFIAGLVVLAACAGGQVSSPTPLPTSGLRLEGLLATKDLGVGANRISFILLTEERLISLPQVTVTSAFIPEDGSSPQPQETATATFHLWPFGTRGNYVTQMSFGRPGRWQLEASLREGAQVLDSVVMPVVVKEASYTPSVGSAPPLVANKTLRDFQDLSLITDWPRPDPDLFQITIAEATASGKPSVIVMSSPAFCTTPTCGPQAETVRDLKEIYKDRANFIHVDIYDNPQETKEDLSRGRYSPVAQAWGLTAIEGYRNESWVFILDRQGRIASKYEGYASIEELEKGLKAVL